MRHLKRWDVIITPTPPTPAFKKIGEKTADPLQISFRIYLPYQ